MTQAIVEQDVVRFTPSRVEGIHGVGEVIVRRDRLELVIADGPSSFPFVGMADRSTRPVIAEMSYSREHSDSTPAETILPPRARTQ